MGNNFKIKGIVILDVDWPPPHCRIVYRFLGTIKKCFVGTWNMLIHILYIWLYILGNDRSCPCPSCDSRINKDPWRVRATRNDRKKGKQMNIWLQVVMPLLEKDGKRGFKSRRNMPSTLALSSSAANAATAR